MKYFYILFILLLTLSACHKDSSSPLGTGSVIIINEGNFGHGNADLSLYDPYSKIVSNNIFKQINGATPGDVAQSLYLLGDTAFIVMNNSAKIVVADAKHNFKYLYTINIPNSSPRFFLPVGGSHAYVTDLYANVIWVIDYRAGTVLRSIAVGGETEQLIAYGGKIYVNELTKPYLGYGVHSPAVHAILMLDPSTDHVVNSLSLASDPGIMVLASNDLFVLAPRQDSPVLGASIYKIDLGSFSISQKIDFDTIRTPDYIRYSVLTQQLLFSDVAGIYTLSPSDTIIPTTPFIPSNRWNVYGLDIDPSSGDVYISDAVDYQQASHIMRYSSSGSLIDHFTAGIITNGFVFKQ